MKIHYSTRHDQFSAPASNFYFGNELDVELHGVGQRQGAAVGDLLITHDPSQVDCETCRKALVKMGDLADAERQDTPPIRKDSARTSAEITLDTQVELSLDLVEGFESIGQHDAARTLPLRLLETLGKVEWSQIASDAALELEGLNASTFTSERAHLVASEAVAATREAVGE